MENASVRRGVSGTCLLCHAKTNYGIAIRPADGAEEDDRRLNYPMCSRCETLYPAHKSNTVNRVVVCTACAKELVDKLSPKPKRAPLPPVGRTLRIDDHVALADTMAYRDEDDEREQWLRGPYISSVVPDHFFPEQ